MDLTLLDTTLELIKVVDVFESLIWTDRYTGYGDFELVLPVGADSVPYIAKKRYLELDDSQHMMIIEHVSIETSIERGNKLIVKGRSLETLLHRRRVWPPIIMSGSLETNVSTLLTQNIINPTDTDRDISNFIFEASGDSLIEAMTVDDQFGPDMSVYEAIEKICTLKGLGFKVTKNILNQFVFKLYLGIDRSWTQFVNPYIEFSPSFENIQNATYQETDILERNVSITAGEKGIGNESLYVVVSKSGGPWTGIDRREMYTDATGITRNVPDEPPLTELQYVAKLEEKALQELAEQNSVQSFEGEIDTQGLYTYGTDYFIGDIVQVVDEYGHEGRSRVAEVIYSQDLSGIRKYPTFATVT